jgi:alkaline phosphatase D
MWKIISSFISILLIIGGLQAQVKLSSSPVVGSVSFREAKVTVEVKGEGPVSIGLKPDTCGNCQPRFYWGTELLKLGNARNLSFTLTELVPGVRYAYRVYQGKKALTDTSLFFNTPVLWEWRTPAPDFSFLTGSCIYINEPFYDRPGVPYGKSRDILYNMAIQQSDFNLWLGDNVYLREADYTSPSGMLARYRHSLHDSAVQALLKSRPNYAIWDDHDYGPNDSDRSFDFKESSLQIFKAFWPNPYYGTPEFPGAFTSFRYSDVEFFLMDNRFYRAPNRMKKEDPEKDYWGQGQLRWLKDKLLASKATFKIVVNGNQVLNTYATEGSMETMSLFPKELEDLLKFLEDNPVSGVMFLSGDRHFTELLKKDRAGLYPLYDFTCSPLTSGVFEKVAESKEGNNPMRIPGSLVTQANYGRVRVSGPKGARELKIEVLDQSGNVLFEKGILQSELSIKK